MSRVRIHKTITMRPNQAHRRKQEKLSMTQVMFILLKVFQKQSLDQKKKIRLMIQNKILLF